MGSRIRLLKLSCSLTVAFVYPCNYLLFENETDQTRQAQVLCWKAFKNRQVGAITPFSECKLLLLAGQLFSSAGTTEMSRKITENKHSSETGEPPSFDQQGSSVIVEFDVWFDCFFCQKTKKCFPHPLPIQLTYPILYILK